MFANWPLRPVHPAKVVRLCPVGVIHVIGGFDLIEQVQQVPDRACKSIELDGHQRIAGPQRLDRPVKLRAPVGALAALLLGEDFAANRRP